MNSDLNICPHCQHDQSRKSFRSLLTIIFIFGITLFFYAKFFSKYSVTILHDGVPQQNELVQQFVMPSQKTDKNGNVKFRKGFCSYVFIIDDKKITWDFLLEADTTINVYYSRRVLEINTVKYGFIHETNIITFATLKQLKKLTSNSTKTGNTKLK